MRPLCWLDVVIGGITVAAGSLSVVKETLGLTVNGSFLSLCLDTGSACVVYPSARLP